MDGLIRLMDAPDDVTGPVYLGNPGEFTIRALAEAVLRLTGSRSPLLARPLPADDPVQRCPDISRAERCLGWRPTVPLEHGLRRTHRLFLRAAGRGGRAGALVVARAPPRRLHPADNPRGAE